MRSDHATPNEPNRNNASQENTMAKAIQKQSASGGTIELRPAALPEGYLPMPQMTDEEIDAELARTGETREQILAEFQDLGARLRAKFLPQPKPAPIIDLPIDDCPKWIRSASSRTVSQQASPNGTAALDKAVPYPS